MGLKKTFALIGLLLACDLFGKEGKGLIEVNIPISKALCYEGRVAVDESGFGNYDYYVNAYAGTIYVSSELKDGRVDNLIERTENVQKILNRIRNYKNKIKETTIQVRYITPK